MKSAESAQPANLNVVPLPRVRSRRRDELAFLPAVVEITETPASPLPRAVGGIIVALCVIALSWACLGYVDIIATAQGKIVPLGRSKTIQPLEVGMITAIYVKDGDRVTEGQVLVELDQIASTSERNRVEYDLMKSRLDVARLTALRAGFEAGTGPSGFAPPPGAPRYEIERTRLMMISQANQQAAKIAGLDKQIAQKLAEADEIIATIAKLKGGLPLLEQEADIREKAMKIQYGNVIAHLDAQLKLSDQRNDLIVTQRKAAETAAAREALEWQRQETMSEYAHGIVSDLADAELKAAQFAEDLIKTNKRIRDETLRAPINGAVQQLAVHTVGGIVTPAQPLMIIAPLDDGIEVEATILNKDIGFVHEGDPVEIKIDTFNFTIYGLLHGKVISVSQDSVARDKLGSQVSADKQQAQPTQSALTSEPPGQELVYVARISLDQTRMQIEDRLIDVAPGMAVTAEIKTAQRRIIEFLLSPLARYKHESLRER
jgi:hemolysin D